jgi:hypothetical protein
VTRAVDPQDAAATAARWGIGPIPQNSQMQKPASCKHHVAGAVLIAHRTGLESGFDDREFHDLRGKLLPPKIRRDPQRRFPTRPGPTQTSHRLRLCKFAAFCE